MAPAPDTPAKVATDFGLRWTSRKRAAHYLQRYVYKVMKTCFSSLAIFTSLLIVVTACSSNNTIKEQEKLWIKKVEQFKPIGKTKAELIEWQTNNNIPLNSFPNKNGIILETIEGDGLVCSRWHIYLSIESDVKGTITAYSVSSAGSCL